MFEVNLPHPSNNTKREQNMHSVFYFRNGMERKKFIYYPSCLGFHLSAECKQIQEVPQQLKDFKLLFNSMQKFFPYVNFLV